MHPYQRIIAEYAALGHNFAVGDIGSITREAPSCSVSAAFDKRSLPCQDGLFADAPLQLN